MSVRPSDLPQPGDTEWTPVSMNQAWGTFGEVGAAFARYRVEDGWLLLEGPGGPPGHAWNAPGPDIVAYRFVGNFQMELTDNKALASNRRVSDASSITTNLLVNARAELERALDRSLDSAPRIDTVRQTLRDTVRALETGGPLPETVSLIVTNYGGASADVTRTLRTQGIRFIDVMPPGTQVAVQPRVPPELFEPPGAVPEPMTREFSPATRATAAFTAALVAAGPLLNALGERVQRGRAQDRLNELRPKILEHLQANNEDGALLLFVYEQLRDIPPDSFLRPGPLFSDIWIYFGRTAPEAQKKFDEESRIVAFHEGYDFDYRTIWIPPLGRPPDPPGFSNSERGLQPEERGALPHERGLSGPPPPRN